MRGGDALDQRRPTASPADGPRNDYAHTLEATRDVIRRRARNHRNHVVGVVLLTAACFLAALVIRSPTILAALLLVVPLSGGFFVLDATVVDRWQRELLANWARGLLELAGVRAAMLADTRLPRSTLEGLLDALPSPGDLAAERDIRTPTRAAAAAVLRKAQARRFDALRLTVAASSIVVAVVLTGIWLRTWTPLPALGLVLLRPLLLAWSGQRVRDAARREVAACRREPEFSEADFSHLVASLR